MSYHDEDDEYQDDLSDDYYDEDSDEESESGLGSSPRSKVNPFSGGSGLPGRDRAGNTPPSSSNPFTRSGPPSSSSPSRDNPSSRFQQSNSPQNAGSSGFNRNPGTGGSSGGTPPSSSSTRPGTGNQPTNQPRTFGSSPTPRPGTGNLGSDDKKEDRPGTSNPFSRPREDEKKPDDPRGSSSQGGFGNRPGGSGAFGSRQDDKKPEERPSGSGGFGNRPSGSGGFGSRPNEDEKRNEERPSGSGGFGNRPSGSGGFGSRPNEDEKRNEERSSGSGGFGNRPSGSGGFGSRPNEDEKRNEERPSGSGGFGNRPSGSGGFGSRPDDKKPEERSSSGSSGLGNRPSGGTGTSSFGARPSDKPADDKKPDDKKPEEKPAPGSGIGARVGGLLGGITNRGGDKPVDDKKPDDKKASDAPAASGGLGARLGGIAAGLTNRGGDKPADDKKPDDKKASDTPAASGGIGARVGGLLGGITNRGGDKPADQDKPAPGGVIGRMQGILQRAKSEDPAPSAPTDKGKPNAPTATSGPPRPGGSTGTPPAATTATSGPKFGAAAGGATPSRTNPAAVGGDKPATPKGINTAPTEESGGLLGQIRQQAKRLIPFGIAAPADESKKAPTSKTRAAKVPQAVNEGMSLDTKLDILGVGLVFGAFVLFTSSISYDQGTITGSINTWIKQIVGWGAIAIPLTMMAIGGWLIGRHFGDEAPKIDVQRLIGVGLAYLSLLVVFHYIESFDPFYTSPQVYEILQPAIIEQGRGGGQIGSLLYMFLLRNASELGGAVVVLGTLVISIMFITRTSAAELTLIVVSAWRSLRVSLQRRAQVREAKRLAQLQATPAAPPQISVQRPAVAELPAPVAQAPALPPPLTLPEMAEPLPIEERAIPIRMGGQMMKPTATAEVRPSEMPSTLPPAATPPPTTTPAPAQPGGIGGIAARLKGAVPSAGALPSMLSRSKPEDAVEEGAKPTAPEDSNRLRNLFGRKPETPAATTPTPTANTPPEEFFAPARPKGLLAAPAASAATETPATGETTPVQPTRTDRLNELRAGGVFNREQSASPTPEEATPKVETPAASVEVKPTTEVKPVTGEPRPGDGAKPAQGLGIPAVQPRPTINVPQAPGHTATPVTPGEPPSEVVSVQRAAARKVFNIPDYQTLLASGSEQDFDRETLVKRAKIIEETLQSFGAPGRVVEINTGPVITQFGVEPDYLVVRGGKKTRVKVSAIAQLDKDLQLALGAKSIRIEAPVPGKGYVGVEVPNEQPATVSLRDVMESKEFTRIKSPLAICLGQSVDGAPVSADLASMPHLLIAGTTGSGKSVCVNAIIASLLLRNSPEVLKFIMVDPKRVELTGYNGIPHLVAPVVVELERIVGVLKWVTREMDERYKKFSNAGARNIEDYNKHLTSGEPIMPYIVVIIDELADLMMLAPEETERTITRIAALARATGIHLVIATQRPSVDVVTGLIKANFPARIAFAVASGVDSRVILDQPGAERLLGRGDMLYLSGDTPAPQRLQGVYVSDTEINNMVRFWRAQQLENPQRPITTLVMDASDDRPLASSGPRFGATSTPIAPKPPSPQRAFWDEGDDEDDEDDLRDDDDDNMEGDDELYEEAVEMVRRLDKASVSLLQRRLRIGYTRAARLIDLMEERGVIGPATEGSKPRDVLPLKK